MHYVHDNAGWTKSFSAQLRTLTIHPFLFKAVTQAIKYLTTTFIDNKEGYKTYSF